MNRTKGALSRREGQDKSLLKSTAQALQKKLSRRLKSLPIHFSGNVAVLEEPDGDGWYVVLATIKGTEPILKIALDEFTSPGQTRFWFGFSASKAEPLRRIEDSCPVRWRQLGGHITGKKLSRSGPGKWRLTKTLPNADLGRPIFEAYREVDPAEFFWGIYAGKSENVIRKALSFFAEMSELWFRIESEEQKRLISELFDEDEICNTTPAIKKRIRKIRKRNAAAARRLKQLYAGSCQISGKQYVFPDKDGKPYTEAHHLVPLGREGADDPSNLIVVSAHIHRMLHCAEVGQIDLSKMRNNKLAIQINSRQYAITWKPNHADFIKRSQRRTTGRI